MATPNSFTVHGFQLRLALKPQKKRKYITPVLNKDPLTGLNNFWSKVAFTTATTTTKGHHMINNFKITSCCTTWLRYISHAANCIHGNEEVSVWHGKGQKRKIYSKSLLINQPGYTQANHQLPMLAEREFHTPET